MSDLFLIFNNTHFPTFPHLKKDNEKEKKKNGTLLLFCNLNTSNWTSLNQFHTFYPHKKIFIIIYIYIMTVQKG